MAGIAAFGAYIPRLRLERKSAVEANGWFNPQLPANARGARAICNWDEDSLTMGVEAARDAIQGGVRVSPRGVLLASTTLPFQDRQNAGVLRAALNLPADVLTLDITGSQRAGTSALLAALSFARSGHGDMLVVAADKRPAKPGSVQELLFGDAAAALVVSATDPIVAVLATHTVATDFVDHYRSTGQRFDYNWEERWVRDQGYQRIVPDAVGKALALAQVEPGRVDHFILPCIYPRVASNVARAVGIPAGAVSDGLMENCGDAGCGHALLMLAAVLERASPGQTIVVASFGQGCDVVVLRTTDRLAAGRPRLGVRRWIDRGRPERNYTRYLSFNDLIVLEKGLRAENNPPTALSALYRKRDMILGLVGGRCTRCGTVQFPKARVCVNPACGAVDSLEDAGFSDRPARIVSWSADWLTFTASPPAIYGLVQFDEGGRLMADFTDCESDDMQVGRAVRMVFRIKHVDRARGFKRYFWKAVPEGMARG